MTEPRSSGVERVGVTKLEALAPVARAQIPVFRDVYEAHVELVLRTLRRVGVPAAAVDDVAQEVFLSIHGALASWEGRSTLRTWIYRITRNAGLNHVRSLRRRPDGVPTDLADEALHGAADPESRAQTQEALGELNQLLLQIDEPKREVLVLMELEEFSAPEVSELLSIPLNTVYSRLRLGRAELERLLESAEVE